MKLSRLKVENVRGLRDLDLDLDGKNVVICGPNGSGKSCVIDAIQFLFTGKMSRLEGSGTSGINLKEHGPHIDQTPVAAIVKAAVHVDGQPSPIEIERCLDKPNNLVCQSDITNEIKSLTDLMMRGGVVLTRRDILKYVTAEASVRAREVQNILNLQTVDDVRKTLVNVNNSLKRQSQSAKQAVTLQEDEVNVHLTNGIFSDVKLLQTVNDARLVLGGGKLVSIDSSDFQEGLNPIDQASVDQATVNPSLAKNVISKIRSSINAQAQAGVKKEDEILRTNLDALNEDPSLLKELEILDLIKQAAEFVDEATTKCPVCDLDWPAGELESHLATKIAAGSRAEKISAKMAKAANAISTSAQSMRVNVNSLIGDLERLGVATEDQNRLSLTSWRCDLDELIVALGKPMVSSYADDYEAESIRSLCSPAGLGDTLSWAEGLIGKNAPTRTPEQTAWDLLTRLHESVGTLENRRGEYKTAMLMSKRSQSLLDSFQESRDSVLGSLYSRVADRFAEYYGMLHDHERDNFRAKLRSRRAALDFEVDFMGRGSFPPNALHSEGHQDSMGLCLFLALNEELAGGDPTIILLDDVMMSVDAGHRKEVCRLLKERFPDCQFVITTHDRTWATQLKHGGVVEKHRVVEFTNWSLETGPIASGQMDLWTDIKGFLEKDDPNTAAFKLRRGSEDFFESACDALCAPVIYNSDMQWELGDWLFAATDRYRQLLKSGVAVARSWNDEENEARLEEMNSIRSQTYSHVFSEQWVINPSVHYNNWENMSKQDLASVVDAFRGLFGLFECMKCGSLIEQFPRGRKAEVVKCRCSAVSINLQRKLDS